MGYNEILLNSSFTFIPFDWM